MKNRKRIKCLRQLVKDQDNRLDTLKDRIAELDQRIDDLGTVVQALIPNGPVHHPQAVGSTADFEPPRSSDEQEEQA